MSPLRSTGARQSFLTFLRPYGFPVVVYVMSRFVVLSAAYFVAFMKEVATPREHAVRVFTSGANEIYRVIAQHGYPATVPARGPNPYGASPLYPLLLRVANKFSPLSRTGDRDRRVDGARPRAPPSAVWQVARSLFDRVTADRAVLLFCFLPGAYVLSFASPDSLLVLLAVICLLSLTRRYWVARRGRGLAGHRDAARRARARGVRDRRRRRGDPTST